MAIFSHGQRSLVNTELKTEMDNIQLRPCTTTHSAHPSNGPDQWSTSSIDNIDPLEHVDHLLASVTAQRGLGEAINWSLWADARHSSAGYFNQCCKTHWATVTMISDISPQTSVQTSAAYTADRDVNSMQQIGRSDDRKLLGSGRSSHRRFTTAE